MTTRITQLHKLSHLVCWASHHTVVFKSFLVNIFLREKCTKKNIHTTKNAFYKWALLFVLVCNYYFFPEVTFSFLHLTQLNENEVMDVFFTNNLIEKYKYKKNANVVLTAFVKT